MKAHQIVDKVIYFLKGKFSLLLVSQLLMIILFPIMEGDPTGSFVLNLIIGIILLSSIRAVYGERSIFIVLLVLFLLSCAGDVALFAGMFSSLKRAILIVDILFLSLAAIVVFINVFKGGRVTYDHISGALCVYIYIGLIWALIYYVLELSDPHSISCWPDEIMDLANIRTMEKTMFSLVYFSFSTLTTMGYGDIVPLSNIARAFAYLEAIIGQIYLTVLIARIVGIHITQSGILTDEVEK